MHFLLEELITVMLSCLVYLKTAYTATYAEICITADTRSISFSSVSGYFLRFFYCFFKIAFAHFYLTDLI